MGKFSKKYLFIIPIILIFIGTIGILLHKDQKLAGTFYLVVSEPTSRTKTISGDFVIEINEKEVIIKDHGKIEKQVIGEETSFYISGKKYFYNYNTGHLILTQKINDSEFDSIELVSIESPMFESYKNGTVRY